MSMRRAGIVVGTLCIAGFAAVAALGARSPQAASATSQPTRLVEQDVAVASAAASSSADISEEELNARFEKFVADFDKFYPNDAERTMRRDVFRRNLGRIDEMNAAAAAHAASLLKGDSEGGEGGGGGLDVDIQVDPAPGYATYDVTWFADWTREEFQAQLNSGKVSDEAKDHARAKTQDFPKDYDDVPCQAKTRYPELCDISPKDMPSGFDWRDLGAVTKVKNQAMCGSCWSFSVTGDLEGSWYVTGHDLISLSEQQLVTCDTQWNQGCNGGWPALSMLYIADVGGIVPEEIYPYRKVNMYGPTTHPPVCSDVVKEGNYAATLEFEVAVAQGSMDEDLMAYYIMRNGPMSVALDATGMDFYSDGVDMGGFCNPMDLNHAVLIVGWGVDQRGTKYWIVKNSWAVWWGERGYYRLVRGFDACGIASEATKTLVGDASVSASLSV